MPVMRRKGHLGQGIIKKTGWAVRKYEAGGIPNRNRIVPRNPAAWPYKQISMKTNMRKATMQIALKSGVTDRIEMSLADANTIAGFVRDHKNGLKGAKSARVLEITKGDDTLVVELADVSLIKVSAYSEQPQPSPIPVPFVGANKPERKKTK